MALNSLNKHFENDERVTELEMDASELQRLIKGKCLLDGCILFPPALVASILGGVPCMVPYRCYTAHKVTDAHHLVLRKNSLQLRVDPHTEIRDQDCVFWPEALCWCCLSSESTGTTIVQTIPLQEIDACEVEPGLDDCLGGRTTPNTLKVSLCVVRIGKKRRYM